MALCRGRCLRCWLGQQLRPFPENRVQDFYFHQAEEILKSGQPIPEFLAQFPGMDGGAFGHWGQNPAEASNDDTLNDVDSGNVICSRIRHFGHNTQKGVALRLTQLPATVTAVFDPLTFSFIETWSGGFVSRGSGRFGVHDGAAAVGNRLVDLTGSCWQFPAETKPRYLGFHRHGQDVVFSYRVGDCHVLDRMWMAGPAVIRSLQFEGSLPPGTMLKIAPETQDSAAFELVTNDAAVSLVADKNMYALKFGESPADGSHSIVHLVLTSGDDELMRRLQEFRPADAPESLTIATDGQWTTDTTATKGQLGSSTDSFAIDTLTIPFAEENAFGTPMRLAGCAVLPGGRMAVSTLLGDVWIVSGVDSTLNQLTWQRFAAGLYQPLGLVVQDGKIIAGGNDQVTRLHDFNEDGEADFYECVTNDYPTTGGHDFATSLQQDVSGRLYWAVASHDFGLARCKPGQKPESLGTGLRNCNGIGVSADGSITLATVQEGTWTPASAIFNVHDGSYHGLHGPRPGHGEFGYDLPQCFIPRCVDNSCGEIRFLPKDDRLGPLSGMVIGSSYGNCSHYLVLREEVNGVVQGGVVPLPGEFASGACRLTFNEDDGCIYVAGTEGWQSYGRDNGCLQRLRFTGQPMPLPVRVETRENGLLVHFNCDIRPDSVQLQNVFCQQWNYLYSQGYGSPEYSVKQEGRQGHDSVAVQSVHLLDDHRSVFVEIPQLHSVMQFHLHMKLETADGIQFTPDAYLTIYETGSAFTDFPGYRLIAKRRWPGFPKAETYPQDPRLVQQDALGTNFGWVANARKMSLNAVTGLQYEPRRLKVAPGTRVALTFHNTDPGMPHNVVILKADQVDAFGDQAMMLASNPRAIATHYVPDDPAEICFSPILNPGDQYTVYFEAPQETGRYALMCTYPGHSKIMRGSLYVLPDDQPLPEPTPDEIGRKFVQRWAMTDFPDLPQELAKASPERGAQVFTLAGCIKCHRVRGQGTQLGPELTDVTKRFQGARLLQQILEPSVEINKQYQTWLAVTAEGVVKSGLMVKQTDDSITLLPNPLRPEETITLNTADLDELSPSHQSTMPEGLLMTFNRSEILDLVSFLQSATP
ncbi:MAG: plastocyanin/azurin family copper-binding protein [Planctomycetaceae bacterium]